MFERRSRLVLGLVLATFVIIAGTAAAHGKTISETKTVPPYEITFHSFQSVTQGENVTVAWAVANASTGDRPAARNASATFVFFDDVGAEVHRTTEDRLNLTQGYHLARVTMAQAARYEVTLQLEDDNATRVTFAQPIEPPADEGPAEDPGDATTPLPMWAVPVALGLAGLGWMGRRG